MVWRQRGGISPLARLHSSLVVLPQPLYLSTHSLASLCGAGRRAKPPRERLLEHYRISFAASCSLLRRNEHD